MVSQRLPALPATLHGQVAFLPCTSLSSGVQSHFQLLNQAGFSPQGINYRSPRYLGTQSLAISKFRKAVKIWTRRQARLSAFELSKQKGERRSRMPKTPAAQASSIIEMVRSCVLEQSPFCPGYRSNTLTIIAVSAISWQLFNAAAYSKHGSCASLFEGFNLVVIVQERLSMASTKAEASQMTLHYCLYHSQICQGVVRC